MTVNTATEELETGASTSLDFRDHEEGRFGPEAVFMSEVEDVIDSFNRNVIYTGLDKVSITEDSTLTFDKSDKEYPFDSLGREILGEYFGMPRTFVRNSDRELQDLNLNYFLERENEQTAFVFTGDKLTQVHSTDQDVVYPEHLLQALTEVLDPKDQIVNMQFDPKLMMVDVVLNSTRIEVPSLETELRPDNDVTHGGVRINFQPQESNSFQMSTYLHRLVCTNGLAIQSPVHKVSFRGLQIEEVYDSLKSNMESLIGELETHLEQYRDTTEIVLEGNPALLVREVALERGISNRIALDVMDQTAALPEGEATLYDLLNLFTSTANQVKSFAAKMALQGVAGEMVNNPGAFEKRCSSCERPLGHIH